MHATCVSDVDIPCVGHTHAYKLCTSIYTCTYTHITYHICQSYVDSICATKMYRYLYTHTHTYIHTNIHHTHTNTHTHIYNAYSIYESPVDSMCEVSPCISRARDWCQYMCLCIYLHMRIQSMYAYAYLEPNTPFVRYVHMHGAPQISVQEMCSHMNKLRTTMHSR